MPAKINIKPQLKIAPKQRFSKTIQLNRNQIVVRPSLFQGRLQPYAKETVNKIVREGYDKSQEPIVVWYDKSIKKYIVISGHSRWEASQILYKQGNKSLKTMPVKMFIGDIDDAIDYAVLESNRSGTVEGFKSDLQAYKRALSRGYNRKKLSGLFKPESKLKLLQDLSYLNTKGRFLEYLGTDSEKQFPYLERNARWMGTLRKQYPKKLTDKHENEVFEFFYKSDKGLKIHKNDFFEMIDKKVTSLAFNPKTALGLIKLSVKRKKTPLQEKINDLEKKIADLNRERSHKEELIVRTVKSGDFKLSQKFQDRISHINQALLNIYKEKAILEKAAAKEEATPQPDLFSQIPVQKKKPTTKKPATKKIVIDNGTTKLNGTYVKIHTSKKALDIHKKKIKARKGKYKVEKVNNGYKIQYSF